MEAFDISVKLYGALAFLLWRSVYITKQVSFRNRVLILLDWWKAQVGGREWQRRDGGGSKDGKMHHR